MMIEQFIEALIFASEKPVTKKEMKECLQSSYGWEVNEEEFQLALENLLIKYDEQKFSFKIEESGGGFQFMTKKDYAPLINIFLNQKSKKRLTRAALETLSIIAYKQPITKAEIEQIRGVNCDYTIQKLLEKELISIAGRQDGPGHPLTYATSEQFMDYFGINSPADLPKLREIEASHVNEIGEAPQVEEMSDLKVPARLTETNADSESENETEPENETDSNSVSQETPEHVHH